MNEEDFVRVNLTLRREDVSYLRHMALDAIDRESRDSILRSLRRGERPGASMGVRLLINWHRDA